MIVTTGLMSSIPLFFEGMGRQRQYRSLKPTAPQFATSLLTVDLRHLDVHQNHIVIGPKRTLDTLKPVIAL